VVSEMPRPGARPIEEADLHALADERLDPARRTEVEAWLASRPQEAERVAEWRAQSGRLRALLDPVLDEPVPERLLTAARPRPMPAWLGRGAAAAALLALGLAGGWLARGWTDAATARPLAQLPERAQVAHRVFSVEVRHPVEVAAAEQDHLVRWLTRRMGHRVTAPDLRAQGFTLVGGRLLAGRSGPACQLMYEDGQGRRITAYIAENPANEQTAFRFRADQGLATFYWLDGSLGYALSGDLPRSDLLAIAEAVYRQLRP
jgi:anti-sigma factor RsiW